MATHSGAGQKKDILVFLPGNAGETIVSALVESGHGALAVYAIPELFDALRSNAYQLAVTSSAEIDLVRHISRIPTINVDALCHGCGSTDDGLGAVRQFDGLALVAHINRQSDPERKREDTAFCAIAATRPVTPRGWIGRWWRAATSARVDATPTLAKK
jgi:hypothetical protein